MCLLRTFLALFLVGFYCSSNATDTNVPLECLMTPRGLEYKGKQNKTASGKTCQAWLSQTVSTTIRVRSVTNFV
ncbi:hypothetical protein LSAT2_000505 [Lamellibrachia satsuma]|nr:hypothetical protein LSAT2_000505 [Lamellibrachia satsuma]